MLHQRTAAGEKLVSEALTKMVVYFKDGNARPFYGRHNATGWVPVDLRELEIKRLKAYAEREARNIQLALLYDLTTNQEIARFKNGTWSV